VADPGVEELVAAIFRERPPPAAEWRRGLRTLAAARASLRALEEELVARARADGATWEQIAADLGLSRKGARARHAEREPPRPRNRAGGTRFDPAAHGK
jgi:hypothetical protein